MVEYRKRHGIGMVVPSAPATTSRTALGYVNLGLPSELSIDDDDSMNWPEVSMEGQSIDKEYNSYNHTARSKMDVDLLLYWEVSTPSYVNCLSQRRVVSQGIIPDSL